MTAANELEASEVLARLRIVIRGLVQGVGFRPFVYGLARRLRLKGWVSNTSNGVFIEVEGHPQSLEQFLTRLPEEKPELSSIESLETSYLDSKGYESFEIRESKDRGAKTALVMPDIATCAKCESEIFDPHNRRYRYPFTNCTHCGPRYSIIEALPYDRCRTAMKIFQMCAACEREYRDPDNRRFHAQPNACPECGPHLELWNMQGKRMASHDQALKLAVLAISEGKIVAVKGLGGFQFLADAQNSDAVRRLRQRKHREEKPFALMAPNLKTIKDHCHVSAAEERLLTSPEAPIVLLRRLPNPFKIVEAVAYGNPYLGFMLPCTPLHHLLLSDLNIPVIATSANLPDEPIVIDESEALQQLQGISDYFLVHDRPIVRQMDDSIVRMMMGREMILRRARGYAPLPVTLTGLSEESILAVGAHLKNTIAQSVGDQIFISQHIGDLGTEKSVNAFKQTIHTFGMLYGKTPAVIAADYHPDYYSSQYAKQTRLPVIQVQHHYAHVLSCMAENELNGPVLGVSWDGTGLGDDGTVWGGEFLWVNPQEYVRTTHLRGFKLPGGEKAIKEPRRCALAVLYEIFGDNLFDMKLEILGAFENQELRIIRSMLRQNIQSPVTSSAGRLFDAVAALSGMRKVQHFEGQAAMELEFAIDGHETDESYPALFSESAECVDPAACQKSAQVLDWEPLVRGILADRASGIPAGKIAAKFHNTLAESILHVALSVREPKVVLTGGCFQNKYLLERSVTLLRQKNFTPYWHQKLPPNDGGISLGQIMGAVRILKKQRNLKRELTCA